MCTVLHRQCTMKGSEAKRKKERYDRSWRLGLVLFGWVWWWAVLLEMKLPGIWIHVREVLRWHRQCTWGSASRFRNDWTACSELSWAYVTHPHLPLRLLLPLFSLLSEHDLIVDSDIHLRRQISLGLHGFHGSPATNPLRVVLCWYLNWLELSLCLWSCWDVGGTLVFGLWSLV